MIELSTYENQIITQNLPPHLAGLKSKYPSTVYNAASAQNLEPLAPGVELETINIYYGEEDNGQELPNLSFRKGKLDLLYLTEECENNPVIQIEINGSWTYIEIEKQILLDRIGDLELPKVEEMTEEEIEAAVIKTLNLVEGEEHALFE